METNLMNRRVEVALYMTVLECTLSGLKLTEAVLAELFKHAGYKKLYQCDDKLYYPCENTYREISSYEYLPEGKKTKVIEDVKEMLSKSEKELLDKVKAYYNNTLMCCSRVSIIKH